MRLLIRFLQIALLLLLLAACAGNEEIPPEPESMSENTEEADSGEAAVQEPVQEAHDQDSSEIEGDDVDSDDHPAESDQDGDAEGGDAVDGDDHEDEDSDEDSTDGSEDEDVDAEAISSSDSDQAVAAVGEGWGESGTTAQTACDNPYLPIRQGSLWTYEGDEGPYDWEVIEVEGDLQQATAVMLITIDDLELEYSWNCVEGEGISSFDFAGQGLSSAFPDMTLEVTKGEGAFLAPIEDIVPGHTWDSNVDQIMSFSIGEGDEKIEATGELSTVQKNSILSVNPVTAAGVTVDGVQLEQLTDIAMVMNMMGTDVEQDISVTSLIDMGWGVGIMNQSVESEFGPITVKLLSFFIP